MSTGDQPPLRPVLTLTEEELLVLTDGDLGVVPPRLSVPGDPGAEELVRAVALRTLMARGLVVPRRGDETDARVTGPGMTTSRDAGASDDPDSSATASRDVGVSWEATEPLGLTLSLRELAPVVLGLQRVLGPRRDDPVPHDQPEPTVAVRYLHLHADVAVIEDVTADGMHSLLTVFPDRYPEAVADFIRPPGAVPGEGETRFLGEPVGSNPGRHPAGEAAVADLLAALGHPTVLVEVALLRVVGGGAAPAEPTQQMLALGPGGTFRSWDSRSYHPVDPDRVITDLLAEALSTERHELTGRAPEGDAGTPDAGTPGAGTPGAGTPGAGTPGAGTPDAGTPRGAGAPAAGGPSDRGGPQGSGAGAGGPT
nr:hypothetical protein [Ornithinimicrobium cavernae]